MPAADLDRPEACRPAKSARLPHDAFSRLTRLALAPVLLIAEVRELASFDHLVRPAASVMRRCGASATPSQVAAGLAPVRRRKVHPRRRERAEGPDHAHAVAGGH